MKGELMKKKTTKEFTQWVNQGEEGLSSSKLIKSIKI